MRRNLLPSRRLLQSHAAIRLILYALFLFPFLILVVFLIKIDSKGKVFYKQTRIGKNGKYFTIYKFRTMVSDANNFSKYFVKSGLNTKIGPSTYVPIKLFILTPSNLVSFSPGPLNALNK